jgi:Holliday junction resolvasome RuvABC endonuclease subunit
MRTCIAFDPGTNHTGYCVFVDGKPTRWNVIEPPSSIKDYDLKARYIFTTVELLIDELRPDEIAIEDFAKFHSSDRTAGPNMAKRSMMKCAGIQMGIYAIATSMGVPIVRLVSKGTIKKKDSKRLAKCYGVEHKKDDPIDAFQIGVCAGFDVRRPR